MLIQRHARLCLTDCFLEWVWLVDNTVDIHAVARTRGEVRSTNGYAIEESR